MRGPKMSRYLYCIAHGREHEWEAFCLDFDLAVQGRSFQEVSSLLTQAVENYMQEVAQQPDESVRRALINRRAPLHVRAMWRWRLALAALSGRSHTGESTYGFPVSCPA